MFVFKVVRKTSATTGTSTYAPYRWCTEYRLGETAKPVAPSAGLFVFRKFEDAEKFRHSMLFEGIDHRIMLCRAYGRVRTPQVNEGPAYWIDVWENKLQFTRADRRHFSFPKGTICVSQVTPICFIEKPEDCK